MDHTQVTHLANLYRRDGGDCRQHIARLLESFPPGHWKTSMNLLSDDAIPEPVSIYLRGIAAYPEQRELYVIVFDTAYVCWVVPITEFSKPSHDLGDSDSGAHQLVSAMTAQEAGRILEFSKRAWLPKKKGIFLLKSAASDRSSGEFVLSPVDPDLM